MKYHQRQRSTPRKFKLKVRVTAQGNLPFEAFLTTGINARVKAARFPPTNVFKHLAKLTPGIFLLGEIVQITKGREIKRESIVSSYTNDLGAFFRSYKSS